MAFSAAAFGAAAVTAAGAILKFEADNVLQDGPSALLNPNPPGAVPSVAQAIARQACRRYADDPGGLSDDFAVNMETVCRPYLDNIGYGSGPRLLKPFAGGQCPGGRYRPSGTYVVSCGSLSVPAGTVLNWTAGNECIGPIRGITKSPTGTGWNILHAGTAIVQPFSTSNGRPLTVIPRSDAPCSSATTQTQIASAVEPPLITAMNPISFTDNCGNPPPEITDPVPPTEPGPETEPYNPNPDIDIDITVNLNPDSLIEVNLGLGPVIIAPFSGGGGDGGGGVDPDTSPPAPEPGPELPGGNGGFGGDDGFGEPPAGRRWVGCCITITSTPENASVIATSQPEDVYPGVIGNIRLVFNAAGNRQTDTPVRILAKHVCVWEPVQKINPVGVSVDLLPGYGYTYRPFSVPSGD